MKKATKKACTGSKTTKKSTTTKTKTAKSTSLKPAAGVRKKASTAVSKRSNATVKPKKNIFSGASEISVTENKIAVTKSSSQSQKGKYVEQKERTYHNPTPANKKALKETLDNRAAKKITIQF